MRYIFILLFLVVSNKHYGQNITALVGKVVDNKNDPVERANVILSGGPSITDNIISYTFTDYNGEFHLQLDTTLSDSYLFVSSIGKVVYKSKISDSIDYNSPFLQIILDDKDFLIEEVTINKKRLPYSIKKDTISYDVNSYIDAKDINVEDLLKKLPGVIVTKQGDIFFKGKMISRVFINNMDVFDKNIKIASRNIGAELIDTIQIIENFTENVLLKEFDEDKESVINLKFRKGLTSVFTKIQPGVGSRARLNSQINLYALNNKSGNVFLLNHNNTGETINMIGISDKSDDNMHKLENLPPVDIFSYNYRGLDFLNDLGNFNKLTLGNYNFNHRLNKKQSLKGSFQGYWDINDFTDYQKINYTFPQDPFSYSFTSDIRKRNRHGEMDLQYSNSLKENSNLTSTIKFTSGNESNSFMENVSLENSQANLEGNNDGRLTEFYSSLDYTLSIDKSKILLINSSLALNQHPQNLELINREYEKNALYSVDSTSQISNTNMIFFSGAVNYLLKNNRLNNTLKLTGGFTYLRQNLKTELQDELLQSHLLTNNIGFNKTKLFVAGKYKHSFPIFKLAFELRPVLMNLSDDLMEENESSVSTNHLFLETFFSLSKKKLNYNALLYYGLDYSQSKIQDITSEFYIKAPRVYYKGGDMFLIKSHRILVNYTYFNLFQSTTFFFNALYNYQTPGTGTNILIEDEFKFYKTIQTPSDNALFINTRLDKFIPLINSKLSLSYNLSSLSLYKQINELPFQEFQNFSHTYGSKLVTNFENPFNMELGLNYSTHHYSEENEQNRTNSIHGEIGIRLDYSQRFMSLLNTNFYQYEKNSKLFTFLDFSTKYALNKPNASVEFVVRNILNTKRITQSTLSEYSKSTIESVVQPFYILFKISFYIPNQN
ncbi:hypothetical protein [Maribellus sediminis]|uniref:hypothetical protein n=1 Tax=Maribellus sediminis TaxID=2696285 RepID=UPI0014301FE0|nr:hypothetical protein [Maribellus sediminis]